jgi:hypothetical protein
MVTPLEPTEHALSLTATSDGKKIVLIRQNFIDAVFVADFDRAGLRFLNARRLTLDDRANYPHAWTPDSREVIFESNRNGSYDIFRQGTNERIASQLVEIPKREEVLPQLTPDGQYVLYAAGPAKGGMTPFTLMRVPLKGGSIEEVPTNGPFEDFRCSVGSAGRCVIRTTIGRRQFVYSVLDPIHGIGGELARTAWRDSLTLDWDVSPDGTLVALPNHDLRSARIRIVRLGAPAGTAKEREVDLPGFAGLTGLVWSSDASGWFVSIETSVGRRLFFCDLQGHLNPLGDIYGWAVPSPDGKNVAYLNRITQSNAWMLSSK